MFILSQDKKKLAEYRFVEVSKNHRGNKEDKYCLVGTDYRGISGGAIILGSYSSEETAIAELENIYAAMKNGEAAYAVR